jgi:Spy/CpxP family protein refolding chaperone
MKPWIKRTLFGLMGATVLLGGLTACGHRQDGHGWQMSAEEQTKFRARMIERVSARLDLSEAQKQRLGVLADKLQAQRAALAGSGADPRAQVQALVAGTSFDRARAQALVTEKTAALDSKSPEVIAALADFYDGLDPAQQQKVRDFLQRRGGWRRG